MMMDGLDEMNVMRIGDMAGGVVWIDDIADGELGSVTWHMDPNEEEYHRSFRGHGYEVNDIVITSNDSHFHSCDGGGSVYYWDLATGERINNLEYHNGEVNVIRCWQQGDGIVSGGSDCFVRVWDPCSSESRQSNVLSLCTTSNNNILAGCFDGTIREIDHRHLRRASDTEILHKYKGHQCYQYGDSPRPQPKRLNGNCLGERQGKLLGDIGDLDYYVSMWEPNSTPILVNAIRMERISHARIHSSSISIVVNGAERWWLLDRMKLKISVFSWQSKE
ncbi:WD repeat domain-containing protein 83 [Tanacetum coccineum]